MNDGHSEMYAELWAPLVRGPGGALFLSGPDPRDMNPMPGRQITHPNGLQIGNDSYHIWDQCENFQLKDFRTRVDQIYERPLRQL
jgi:hypothetical protein